MAEATNSQAKVNAAEYSSNGSPYLSTSSTSASYGNTTKNPFYGNLPRSAIIFLFVCAGLAVVAVIVILYLYEIACFKTCHGRTCVDVQYSRARRARATRKRESTIRAGPATPNVFDGWKTQANHQAADSQYTNLVSRPRSSSMPRDRRSSKPHETKDQLMMEEIQTLPPTPSGQTSQTAHTKPITIEIPKDRRKPKQRKPVKKNNRKLNYITKPSKRESDQSVPQKEKLNNSKPGRKEKDPSNKVKVFWSANITSPRQSIHSTEVFKRPTGGEKSPIDSSQEH